MLKPEKKYRGAAIVNAHNPLWWGSSLSWCGRWRVVCLKKPTPERDPSDGGNVTAGED